MTSGEHINVIETAEEIKRERERRPVNVSDETKQELSDHAITLMAIESAIDGAS